MKEFMGIKIAVSRFKQAEHDIGPYFTGVTLAVHNNRTRDIFEARINLQGRSDQKKMVER